MVQQSNTAAKAVGSVHQHIDTARDDPTAPLWLGTDVETDDPVTVAPEQRFSPLLITGTTRTGKTTLCHHIATQQLVPDSGLCYVSASGHAFAPPQPTDRMRTTISPTTARTSDPSVAVPADIGMETTIHSVRWDPGTDTATKTALTQALIDQLLTNLHRQRGTPGAAPYTLVLDGLTALGDIDPTTLDQLLSEAHTCRLSVVIATQTLTRLPSGVQHPLDEQVLTALTGRVAANDATHLAHTSPTVTPDDLHTLPRYQWWLWQDTREGPQDHQFASAPLSAPTSTSTHDEGEP